MAKRKLAKPENIALLNISKPVKTQIQYSYSFNEGKEKKEFNVYFNKGKYVNASNQRRTKTTISYDMDGEFKLSNSTKSTNIKKGQFLRDALRRENPTKLFAARLSDANHGGVVGLRKRTNFVRRALNDSGSLTHLSKPLYHVRKTGKENYALYVEWEKNKGVVDRNKKTMFIFRKMQKPTFTSAAKTYTRKPKPFSTTHPEFIKRFNEAKQSRPNPALHQMPKSKSIFRTIKRAIIQVKKNLRDIKDLFHTGIRILRGKDVIYPINEEIAKNRKLGKIPKPNYKLQTKTGPVPKGRFHSAFYNSKIVSPKPGEKFGFLRRAKKSADVLDKLAAREGKTIEGFGQTFKRFKVGFRAAAVVHSAHYNYNRLKQTIGNVLNKLGSVGKSINAYAKKQTLSSYRKQITKLQAHKSLKYVPYAHTNLIREASGVKYILAKSAIAAVGAGLAIYGASKLIKSKQNKTKQLLSRQEKNKRISIGLKKSTKFKNRKRK